MHIYQPRAMTSRADRSPTGAGGGTISHVRLPKFEHTPGYMVSPEPSGTLEFEKCYNVGVTTFLLWPKSIETPKGPE